MLQLVLFLLSWVFLDSSAFVISPLRGMPLPRPFPTSIDGKIPNQGRELALAVNSRNNRKQSANWENRYRDDDEDDDDWSNDGLYWDEGGTDYDDDDDDFYLEDDDDSNAAWEQKYKRSQSFNEHTTPPESSSTTNEVSHFFSKKSLRDSSFPQTPVFHNLCRGAEITRPSKIQSMAWPILLRGENAIVADQTGSGKTLAYLIPLLARILQKQPSSKASGMPRLVVLSPTAELADQTCAVCERLSAYVNFRTMVVTSSGKYSTTIRDQIRLIQRSKIDVLISTPGRLSTILRTRNSGLDLSALQAIVLDEVDVLLLDETFGPQLRTVGAAAPVQQTQFIFVTATLPQAVVDTVQAEFPLVRQVKGPGLHRVAPTIRENLVDVSVPPEFNRNPKACFDVKAKALLQAMRETRCRRTLIFCNTIASCRRVENLLQRRDRRGQIVQVRAYHNAMTPESRNENLAWFAAASSMVSDNYHHSQRQRQQPRREDVVLVCTDRAARGVDFGAAPVDHVVLYDFPKDPAEYIRRVGRTARAGREGVTTVLAFGWQLPIAKQVMMMKHSGQKPGKSAITLDMNPEDGSSMENDEYSAKMRRKQRHNSKKRQSEMIKSNIENQKMWR